MILDEYKKKGKFTEAPKPTRGAGSESQLHFVVQEYAAAHFHYDFRLA
jgi:hypothetical protein